MQIQEMKKGLFGYKKESVYQYVSALNEEFSQKLIEKDEKNEVLVKELRERTQALEAELERVKRESEELRKKQLAVSDSIIDARDYAAQLKSETRRREQALYDQMEARMSRENRRLDGYAENIGKLREQIKDVLEQFDEELKQAENKAGELMRAESAGEAETEEEVSGKEGAAPEAPIELLADQNMTLFQRRKI